jgi:tRNA-Thr(GGU) m(6)t(6)A37 methyltransferase TsaA
MKSKIVFKSIGKVQSEFREEDTRKYPMNKVVIVASLIIDHRFAAALDCIESYSHLIILYHMHRATVMKGLRIHPRGKKEIAKVGLFATRSPYRPNPIGVTIVKLLERRRNVLKVKGLDAVNNTPILDIKPYTNVDVKQKIRVPEWTRLKK